MKFVEALENSEVDMVYLVKSKDEPTGKDAWWYVQVQSKQKLPIFLHKVQFDGIDLADYGNILCSGWGVEPPADIKQKIKEQFG